MQRWIKIVQRVVSCRQFIHPKTARPLFLSNRLFHRHFSSPSRAMSQYDKVERGCLYSQDYRLFITDSTGKPISPFHDIPLYADAEKNIFNMVVEIPRWTNAKMEICTSEVLNPIKQDVKNGKVRFVKNCFPHHGYIWNYGALPQTWEDVDHVELETGTKGDNDPLDVCEIGQKVHSRGSIIQVKALGIMCLIDEGETDWKVLVIDVTDPLADQLNDIEDIDRLMPGFVAATREWFTIYKMPDKKPANQFAFGGEARGKDFALKVINETHKQWKRLVGDREDCTRGELCCKSLSVEGSPYKINEDEVNGVVEQSAVAGESKCLPDGVDTWYYVSPPSQSPPSQSSL